MAGFPGLPLGSFSGRGADFQPFQFIMQLRQRQAEQEQARKEQAQAAQQSFLMAVMSQKQQQQAMQQRQQEAMMQREMEQQNQARLADQFRSEQSRLQGAERERSSIDRLREERLGAEEKRLAGASAARIKEDDDRRAASVKLEGAEAGAADWISATAEPAFAETLKVIHDPIAAMADVERTLIASASQEQDPTQRRFMMDKIAKWKAQKRQDIMFEREMAPKPKPEPEPKAERAGTVRARGLLAGLRKGGRPDIVELLDEAEKQFPDDPEAQLAYVQGAAESMGVTTETRAVDPAALKKAVESDDEWRRAMTMARALYQHVQNLPPEMRSSRDSLALEYQKLVEKAKQRRAEIEQRMARGNR